MEDPLQIPSLDTQVLPKSMRDTITTVVSSGMFAVAIFGIFSNVANMVVFYRIGLSTSAYVCFFALAASDLLTSALVFLLAINNLELVHYDTMLMSLQDVCIMSSPLLYAVYSFGSWLTTLLSLERACAVVFPLKVKSIFTRKIAWGLLCLMAVYLVATTVPNYVARPMTRVTLPETNRTRIIVDPSAFDLSVVLTSTTLAFLVPTYSCFVLVIVSTTFLIVHYRRSTRVRQKLTGNKNTTDDKKPSIREGSVVRTVVVIGSIYIGGFSLNVGKYVASYIDGRLSLFDPYLGNLNAMLIDIAFLLQTVSCSVNIIVYYKMNSSYRKLFSEIFIRHKPKVIQ